MCYNISVRNKTVEEICGKQGVEALINFQFGQIVFSKQGRDKGLPRVVIESCGEYVYLADGKHRLLAKPKKKKWKHVQPTSFVSELLTNSVMLKDSDLRKAVAEFLQVKVV